MKWNNEQLEAINATGTNILVSASAGAGKTAVLVERLVKRCLVDHIELNEILAMTFTEAAANEMKKRLSRRLNEEYTKDSVDKDYIAKQLVLLQDAKISTIHSFCLDLIKKHADAIGLDPNCANHILNDGQLELAKKTAFEKVLSSWCTHSFDKISLLSQYFSPRSEDFSRMSELVFNIIQKASSSSDEAAWYTHAMNLTSLIKKQEDCSPILLDYFFSSCRLDLDIQLNYLYDCKKCVEQDSTLPDKVLTSILCNIEFLNACKEELQAFTIDGFTHAFRRALSKPLEPYGKSIPYSGIRKLILVHREKCISLYPDFETLKTDSNQMAQFSNLLLMFSKEVSEELQQNKTSLKSIHFDDMDKFAYKLLCADSCRIAKIYQQSLKEILVDEFQDTSELQNEIICLLSNGNNVFRVGDVKQSIYRFRKAKPDIMRSYMNDSVTKQINLAYNYRSNHSIVSFTNDLFNQLMNVDGCKNSYRECDHVQAGSSSQKAIDSPVEFYRLHQKEIDPTLSKKQAKAIFIAQKIIEMKNTTEFTHWRDYVILAKSHADKNLLKQVFRQFNIPHSIDAKEGFYQSFCCHILLSMLRCVDKIDDIPMVAVLTSPLYHMSDDQLAKLKISTGSLYSGLLETNHPFILDIQRCRTILKKDGLCALLNTIAEINHFVRDELDMQQRTNFDLFFKIASDFQKTSTSLKQFINQINLSIDEKSDEATSLGDDDDVVRAITIHHSKGLQYKVVFYWSTSINALQDKKQDVLVDSDLGIGLYSFQLPYRLRRPTFQRIAIEHKINLEDIEESIRVLYVALTRAESKLILLDTVDDDITKKNIALSLYNSRKGMTPLILSALSSQSNFIIHDTTSLTHHVSNEATRSSLPYTKKYTHPLTPIIAYSPSSTENYFIPKLNPSKENNYGTTLHEIIEKLPNHEWTLDDLTPYQDDLTPYQIANKEALIQFSKSDLYKKCCDMEIFKEYSFSVLDKVRLIHGSFDFIALDNKTCILIDFKTDQHVSENDLLHRYTEQISTYRLALNLLYPDREISTFLYSFSLEKYVEIK